MEGKKKMKVLGLSLTSYESGFALLEGKKVDALGELNITKDRGYVGRLKDIFYQSKQLIYKFEPDFIALNQEILTSHPGTTLRNARILGLILAASWTSSQKPKVIEISSGATNQVCGLHAFTKLATKRDKVIEAVQKMYPQSNITNYRRAEAVAICIAAKWRIDLWEKRTNEK